MTARIKFNDGSVIESVQHCLDAHDQAHATALEALDAHLCRRVATVLVTSADPEAHKDLSKGLRLASTGAARRDLEVWAGRWDGLLGVMRAAAQQTSAAAALDIVAPDSEAADVLVWMVAHGEAATVSEIAAGVGKLVPGASRALRKLDQGGLVIRSKVGRRKLCSVTPKGRKVGQALGARPPAPGSIWTDVHSEVRLRERRPRR